MKRLTTLCFLLFLLVAPWAHGQIQLATQVEGTSRTVAFDDGAFATFWLRPTAPFETGFVELVFRAVSQGSPSPFTVLSPPIEPGVFDVAGHERILAVWSEPPGFGALGQLLTPQGDLIGFPFPVAGGVITDLSVAAHETGFAVAWLNGGTLRLRHFDLEGQPTTEVITIVESFFGFGFGNEVSDVAVVARPHSSVVVYNVNIRSEGRPDSSGLTAQRVLADGTLARFTDLGGREGRDRFRFDLAPYPDGGSVLAWEEGDPDSADLWLRRLDGEGRPITPARPVSEDEGLRRESLRVSADDGGGIVAAWRDTTVPRTAKVFLRSFDSLGHPMSPVVPVVDDDQSTEIGADLAFVGGGSLVASYFADAVEPLILAPEPDVDTGLQALRLRLDCRPDATTLCLREGRFEVRVEVEDVAAPEGRPAMATPITSDTGGFWFFSEDNLEVLVKVLDGRPVNGHFWVLFGSLSNLPYTVVVTDTRSGRTRRFSNPSGVLASQAITEAFPDDGSPPTVAAPVLDAPDGACPGLADPALCLTQGRFRATVEWLDPRSGRTGFGTGRLISENSGAYWFFGPENLELILKVLDGRPSNGHFWVFLGSLTDVEVNILVEDTETGERWTYRKPPFVLESFADTEALPAPGP